MWLSLLAPAIRGRSVDAVGVAVRLVGAHGRIPWAEMESDDDENGDDESWHLRRRASLVNVCR